VRWRKSESLTALFEGAPISTEEAVPSARLNFATSSVHLRPPLQRTVKIILDSPAGIQRPVERGWPMISIPRRRLSVGTRLLRELLATYADLRIVGEAQGGEEALSLVAAANRL
jgi:hypothetical protein